MHLTFIIHDFTHRYYHLFIQFWIASKWYLICLDWPCSTRVAPHDFHTESRLAQRPLTEFACGDARTLINQMQIGRLVRSLETQHGAHTRVAIFDQQSPSLSPPLLLRPFELCGFDAPVALSFVAWQRDWPYSSKCLQPAPSATNALVPLACTYARPARRRRPLLVFRVTRCRADSLTQMRQVQNHTPVCMYSVKWKWAAGAPRKITEQKMFNVQLPSLFKMLEFNATTKEISLDF